MLKFLKKTVSVANRNRKLMKDINSTIYDADIAWTYPCTEDQLLSAQKVSQLIDACYKAQKYLDIVGLETYYDRFKTSCYPTNCLNCGAPMHSNKCEYCGSEYNKEGDKINERSEPSLQFLQSDDDSSYELLS